MNILLISEYYPPDDKGGAERHVYNLRECLESESHEVAVASFSSSADFVIVSPERELRKEMGDFYFTSKRTLKAIFTGTNIHDIIRDVKPDVVHLHNIHDYSAVRDLCRAVRRMHIPMVWTAHDYWFVCPWNTLIDINGDICPDRRCTRRCFASRPLRHRLMISWILKRPQCLRRYRAIAPAKFMASILAEEGYTPTVIPLGHPSEELVSIPPPKVRGELRVLYQGNLGRHKGVHVLIEAIKRVHDGVRFRISGDGPLRDKVAALADERENVEYLGWDDYSRVLENLRWADIVVLPSIWYENSPLSIIEAMFSARAVVASAIGGIPELVRDGKTGVLVPPGNVDALARAITVLSEDGERVVEMGRFARETAIRRHDMEKYCRHILSIYREVSK